jgi:hypothetical protein
VENFCAFGTDNRRAIEVEKRSVTAEATALSTQFRFGHGLIPRDCPCLNAELLLSAIYQSDTERISTNPPRPCLAPAAQTGQEKTRRTSSLSPP